MKVYFISGLAADQAVFQHIRLPQGFEAVPLDWIAPQQKESLESYALRLSAPIQEGESFVLVGLSMGGMMASEIARTKHPALTILISSIPVSKQLPVYYRVLGALQFHRMVPVSVFRNASLLKRVFSFESKEDKTMLRKMIRRADPKFIHWAMGAILRWKNEELPERCLQIHGSRDELLPLRYTKPTHVIEGGTHLMVLNKAREINAILAVELPKLQSGSNKP